MKNKMFLVFLVVTLIMSLTAFGACKAEEEAPPVPTPIPTPTPKPALTPPPTPTPTPTQPPPIEQPKYGGILNFWVGFPPGGFDLHRIPAYGPFACLPIFNNLVSFDPKKETIMPEDLIGDLAEKWEISSDGKSITFFLNKGVKWHDGASFTAADVAYSIEKMTDPDRSRIQGRFPAYRNTEMVDDHTVIIHLKYPSASLITQFAGPYAVIQAKHTASIDSKSTDFLMGTGPFRFKRYQPPVSFEVEKNPDYFKKGLPYLDGVRMTYITDYSARENTLITKRVDMTAPSIAFTGDSLNRIREALPDAVWKIVHYPYSTYWMFNQNYEPLSDPRVRRAIALVDDPVEQRQLTGSGPEWGELMTFGIFPKPWGLPVEDIRKLMSWDKPFEERVAEAQALMKEAGYASGFKIKILGRNVPVVEDTIIRLCDLYRRYLNIEAEPVLRSGAEFNRSIFNRDYHVVAQQILALVGDPDEFSEVLMTGGSMNITGYSNSKVDQLFQEQSWTIDLDKRTILTQELERTIMKDMPGVPSGNAYASAVVWHPYVKGFVPAPSGYCQAHERYEYVWLDK
ncbi:ABC transporter substrate-binding protein [Chloroflexota bacterium]